MKRRDAIAFIFLFGLVFLPLVSEMARPLVYILGIILVGTFLFVQRKYDKYFKYRFMKKWEKERERSLIYQVIKGIVLIPLFTFVIAFLDQLIFEPGNPFMIFEKLFNSISFIIVLVIMMIISPLFIFWAYYQNEKKYEDYYYELNDDDI